MHLQEQARCGGKEGAAGQLPAGTRPHAREPSLLRAIVAAYGWPYLLLGLLKAAGDALNFAGPLWLNLLLMHLAAAPSSRGGAPRPIRILGWRLDAAVPLFGYCCAALLAASLLLKVGRGVRQLRGAGEPAASPPIPPPALSPSCTSARAPGLHRRPLRLPPVPDRQPAALSGDRRRLPQGAGRERRHSGGRRQRQGAGAAGAPTMAGFCRALVSTRLVLRPLKISWGPAPSSHRFPRPPTHPPTHRR